MNCTQIELAHAIAAAIDHGANIINISGGEFTPSGMPHPILADVLDRCDRLGVLIVAAAGNDGCDCLHIPAAHPSILAVGAATTSGEPFKWSNWGSKYQGHGLLAPGENVRGASPGGKIARHSGTSSAAAIVSGVAGLLMSLDIQRGIKPNGPRIRRLLLQSADPCPQMSPLSCRRYLSGVLNIDRAVSFLVKKDNAMNSSDFDSDTQSQPDQQQAAGPLGLDSDGESSPGSMEINPLESKPGPAFASASMTDIVPAACSCGAGGSVRSIHIRVGPDWSFICQSDPSQSLWQHMDAAHNELKEKMASAEESKKLSAREIAMAGKSKWSPFDPIALIWYVTKVAPWDAASVIWTLKIEDTPVYAISVEGPNSGAIVDELDRAINGQDEYDKKVQAAKGDQVILEKGDVERVSLAAQLGEASD